MRRQAIASGVVVAGGIGLFLAILNAAPHAPTLQERIRALLASECGTDHQCQRAAIRSGVDPLYFEAPAEWLVGACYRGDETACRYRDALDDARNL